MLLSYFYFSNIDQVSWRFDTGAVSQLVCLTLLSKVDNFLRHALNTNLSYSHYQRNCLLFLVKGLKN